MISKVHAAIRGVLKSHLPARTSVEFGAPVTSRTGKGLSVFLYEMHEEASGHSAMWSEIRDASGGIAALQPPERRFRLAFLISAWGSDGEQEAQLLDAALTAFTTWEDLSMGNVPAVPEGGDALLAMNVAPMGATDEPWEILKAAGVPARSCFTVVVTSKISNEVFTDLPKPVEKINLDAYQRDPGDTAAVTGGGVGGGAPAGRRWERIRGEANTDAPKAVEKSSAKDGKKDSKKK